uniref:CDS n=1 Tax=Macaca fascicularis TaxID=9541 RepID=A0A7R9NGP6_MACFA|nr:B [Macaca fascicularis] [Macaca fascicularis]
MPVMAPRTLLLLLALGGPGPDRDLGRLALHEVFLHHRVPARPRGAPLHLRGLRG